MKKFLSIIFTFYICIVLLSTIVLAVNTYGTNRVHFERVTVYFQDQFSDVPANQWYTDSIANAFELGLMVGNSDTTFNPHGDVSIAEAVTMAARIYSTYTTGSTSVADNTASPAGSAWYRHYFEYAYANGVISYAYYNCDATQKANRAQFAEIFANALPAEALVVINTVVDDAIPDVKMSERYADYVYKLYRAGILSGSDTNGTFNPQTYITRAEAAAIVSRMAESDNRVSITLGSTPSQTTDNNSPQTGQSQQRDTNTAVSLVDMDYISGSERIAVSTNEKDNLGNTHSNCIMNDFERTYMVNGAYTNLTGIIFQEYAKRSDSVNTRAKFEVYGDKKLIYSIHFDSLDVDYYSHASGKYFTGFKPLDFNVNISGVTELRILFGDGEAGTLLASSDGPLALGDCSLHSGAPGQTASNTGSNTEQQQPQESATTAMLVDMDFFAGSKEIAVSTNEKDNLGGTHSDCIMNDFDRTYIINGAYTKMTGIIFQEYAKRSDSVNARAKFEVYGDGKLLHSINFSTLDVDYYSHASGTYFTGFKPIDFSINISGITELRVSFNDGEAGGLVASSDGPLALGDCGLYR